MIAAAKKYESATVRVAVRVAMLVAMLAAVPATSASAAAAADFREQVEADWLLREKLRGTRPRSGGHRGGGKASTRADAAGAVDGVKDGRWGFHTGLAESPWWQVDLGEVAPLSRVLVWNRADSTAARAARLEILLSDDGGDWRSAYTHNGQTFYGFTDKKPLAVGLTGKRARFVRIRTPGTQYLHFDEVEVFGPEGPDGTRKNLALGRPADQVSVSQWSTESLGVRAAGAEANVKVASGRVSVVLERCRTLARELGEAGVDVAADADEIARLAAKLDASGGPGAEAGTRASLHLEARWLMRKLTLSHPDVTAGGGFDTMLFTKRVPPSFNHMSDQYYGWWSRPGGGIYLLRGWRTASPEVECITRSFTEPGSFLRPMVSYGGTKVLFAWCRHYPRLAGERNKLDKAKVPEDAFYHVFEMNVDGTGVRQLTKGKYDDFDARYLPDGRIVFLSTRRGQAIQVGCASAAETLARPDLPDAYVRCGGGASRPVAVYTLHVMKADGAGLVAISPFENFEWTPSVARDGRIIYARWDYVDRHNQPFMSLWSTNPDGTNARIVYGNFTRSPNCSFEARSVPGSRKIVFTGSAHHAQTMGSLVLLDPTAGTEGNAPVRRLTPEVSFPEAEGWPETYYANPWPFSERFYLVSWSRERNTRQGGKRAPNGMGIYLFDAASDMNGGAGSLELLHRDPEVSCMYPIPVRPRVRPPVIASAVERDGPGASEGRFLLMDVYRGLKSAKRGDIRSLRIVAVPAKTQPTMNRPHVGITRDDPGKCVLGTVPVEADGSAYFRVPAGVIVFFQALDERGMAHQTMRTTTHVQPGQTLSCIGCHEPRLEAPRSRRVMALARAPSKITPGPGGSWPLRFDRLVQPVLDAKCVRCHGPHGEKEKKEARKLDLTPAKAYFSLIRAGKPSLQDHVSRRYNEGRSVEGACAARTSHVMAKLAPDFGELGRAAGRADAKGHHGVKLGAEDLERLVTWMDTYAQRLGSFSADQERRLVRLRERWADLLAERAAP